MTFWDFDYPTICAGFALIALVPLAAILLMHFLGRRSRHRFATWLAEWQSMGFTPHSGHQLGFTREHRGRSLTISYAGIPYGDSELLATSVRVVVESPFFLTITPKWHLQSEWERWVYRIAGPKTLEIQDHFSLHSNPPHLAPQLLAHPWISAMLFSDPRPTIELKPGELRFKRPGGFPNPHDALALFDTVCDLAELVEQVSVSSGAA